MPRSIYFDYNATTPLDPAVREAMLPFLSEFWGNPSSVHHLGRKARALLDDARDRAARVLGCKPSEITFTSGGTESNNLAIFGAARLLKLKGNHIVTSAIEHHAVLHSCEALVRHEGFELTVLPVNREGFVSPSDLEKAIRKETTLVSIMAANNETGVVQPVAELGAICQKHGVLFHSDAVQAFGKEQFKNIYQFNADLISICAHKFHGPKGVGLLFSRSPLLPLPLMYGGGHENERRAGTENLPAIIGLVSALEKFIREPVFSVELLKPLSQRLFEGIEAIPGVRIVSPSEKRLVNTVSFVVECSDSISLMAALDLEGVCASSGSACSAGSLEPSHVISALGYPPHLANALVRFSLGRDSTLAEVNRTLEVLRPIVERGQRLQQATKSL